MTQIWDSRQLGKFLLHEKTQRRKHQEAASSRGPQATPSCGPGRSTTLDSLHSPGPIACPLLPALISDGFCCVNSAWVPLGLLPGQVRPATHCLPESPEASAVSLSSTSLFPSILTACSDLLLQDRNAAVSVNSQVECSTPWVLFFRLSLKIKSLNSY